jgi:transposase InsO family protein
MGVPRTDRQQISFIQSKPSNESDDSMYVSVPTKHTKPVPKTKEKPPLPKVTANKVSKKDPFKYLNNITFTLKKIHDIQMFLKHERLPEEYSKRQIRTFLKQFSTDWVLNEEGIPYFAPLDIYPVCEEDIPRALEILYEDPVNSIGKGVSSFYDMVRRNCVGITRNDVEDFLKKKEEYQLTFVKQKKTQKPIYATYSNEKWGADLVDMNQYKSQNKQYRYILTVIDYFSRKVFAHKLKNKDLESTIEAFESIIKLQAEGTYPQMLICDNGSEFQLGDFCKQHKIKLLHTETHSPTQASLIENFNGSLRRLIRANFVRTNSLNWIDDLQMLVDSKNKTKHNEKVKILETTEELKESQEQKISNLSKSTTDRVTKQIAKLQNQTLEVGDKVRVSTSTLHTDIRKLDKAGLSKLVVVKFSAKLYTVSKIIRSRVKKEFQLEKYELVDSKNKPLLEEFNLKHPNKTLKPRRFNISDLLKVDKDTISTRDKATETKLNKIRNFESDSESDSESEEETENVEEEIEEEPKKATKSAPPEIRKSSRAPKSKDILDL